MLESERLADCMLCPEHSVNVRTHWHLSDVSKGRAYVRSPDEEALGFVLRERDGWHAFMFGDVYPEIPGREPQGVWATRSLAVRRIVERWVTAQDAFWAALERRRSTPSP